MNDTLSSLDRLIARSTVLDTVIDVIASKLAPMRTATALICGTDNYQCFGSCIDCNCPGCGPCFGFNCQNITYSHSSVACVNGVYTARSCSGCCI